MEGTETMKKGGGMKQRTTIGGFRPFGEGERPCVYGKDLTDGCYRSRFGYLVFVRGGRSLKQCPNGQLVEIHPHAYSVFYREGTKALVDARVEAGTMVARGDNCEGRS